MKKYQTIVIDPPWTVYNNLKNLKYYRTGKKMPYPLMSDDEIKNFPINDFADERCDLFLWTITSKIPKKLSQIKLFHHGGGRKKGSRNNA